MPSNPELKLIHAEILDLLKLFDAFCTANDIRYTLDAGTLLGAVREHGFIPWDDDADVAMTRAEYEKFRGAARRGPLPEDVTFSEFSAQHPRVWMRRPGRPGAWIDLFIYDYITENRALQKLRLLGCAFFLVFTKNKTSLEISRKNGGHRGLRARLMTFGYLLGKPFSPRTKARLQNAFAKHALHGRRTLIHRSNDAYSFIGRILPAGVMSRYERMSFEDVPLMVTSDYHDVLLSTYGADYMTPKRQASHDNPAHAGFMVGEAPGDGGERQQ